MISIRKRLIIYFFSTICIILLSLSILSYIFTMRVVMEQEVRSMKMEATNLSEIFEQYLLKEVQKLEVISRNNILVNDYYTIDEKLEYLRHEEIAQKYVVMDYVEPSGLAHLTNGKELVVTERDYFKKAINGESAVSELLISKDDGKPIFVFAVPVLENDKVKGVIVAIKDVTGMCDYLIPSDSFDSTKEYVVDKDGTIIASTDVNDVIFQKNVHDIFNIGQLSLFKESELVDKKDVFELNRIPYYIVLESIENADWYVMLGVPKSEIEKLLDLPKKVFLIASAFFVFIAFFIIVHLGDKVVKPILKLTDDVEVLKENMFEGGISSELLEEETEVGFLAKSIDELVEHKRNSFVEISNQKREIESLFEQRNKLWEEIIYNQRELLMTLGSVVEAKSQETSDHVERVSVISYSLAKLNGLPDEAAKTLATVSSLHDVGKIAVPDHILNKPGKLTDEEFDIIKKHTVYGAQVLSKSELAMMKVAKEIALNHHEWWNGYGYPYGIKGNNIPESARIVAIADVFDSLASERCYKKPWSYEKIYTYFEEQKGVQFDPSLTDIFLTHYKEFVEIREEVGVKAS